jgi:hypothetical protein
VGQSVCLRTPRRPRQCLFEGDLRKGHTPGTATTAKSYSVWGRAEVHGTLGEGNPVAGLVSSSDVNVLPMYEFYTGVANLSICLGSRAGGCDASDPVIGVELRGSLLLTCELSERQWEGGFSRAQRARASFWGPRARPAVDLPPSRA